MSIWNVIQNVQSGNAKSRPHGGKWAGSALAGSRIGEAELQERVERLQLMVEAMWELMSERERLTLTDLAHRARAIEARQGADDDHGWDGVRAPEFRCSSCRAVIPAAQTKCQFCGTESAEARNGSWA